MEKKELHFRRWASGNKGLFTHKKERQADRCFHYIKRCKDHTFYISRFASNVYCEHSSTLPPPAAANTTKP